MAMPEGPVRAQHRIATQYLDSVSAGERNASGSATSLRLEFYPPDYPVEPPTPGFKVHGERRSPTVSYHPCATRHAMSASDGRGGVRLRLTRRNPTDGKSGGL